MTEKRRYKITIFGEGSHAAEDEARLMVRELMNGGHEIELAEMQTLVREGERDLISSVVDIKPRHHQIVADIVVDKIYASLSPAELMRGIESGEIPVQPKKVTRGD